MTREEAIKILDVNNTSAKELERIKNYKGFNGREAIFMALKDACLMAVAALREQEERRWIPVTERLPEIGQKCLIANREIVVRGWLRPDGVWKTGVSSDEIWSKFSLYPPTHWMPLPEPPKEGAEG